MTPSVPPPASQADPAHTSLPPAPSTPLADTNKILPAVLVFALLCLLTVTLTKITTTPDYNPEAGVVMNLPENLLGMPGSPQEVSEAERLILPEDTQFAKMVYTDPDGNTVSAQIVLSGADRRSIHRPEACLPGQGWNILSSEPLDVELQSGRTLRVQKLRLLREIEIAPGIRRNLPMLFLYWYVGKGLTTHSQKDRVLRTNLDLLLHNKVHRWAYVIVSAPVMSGLSPRGLTESETLERLKQFIREAVPHFQISEMPNPPAIPTPKP